LYRNGLGVPQDFVCAYQWYSLAAMQGQTDAIIARDSLLSIAAPQQIAEGQRLARDWFDKFSKKS